MGNMPKKTSPPKPPDDEMERALKYFSHKGGMARARNLSPEQRQEIARMGALAKRAKWDKRHKVSGAQARE